MRAGVLVALGFVLILSGVIALIALLAASGAEVRGFGIILIGPVPIIVTDGQHLPLILLLALPLLLFVLLALRRMLPRDQQD
ncbi:MAG: hypothetical protein QXZ03_06910 [Nitrososphaerota archaeon]|nr:hypothetical protein [Candidatus Calditenuis fumarioli]